MKTPRKTPGAASRRRFLATVAAGAAGGAAAASLLPGIAGAAGTPKPKRRPVAVSVHPLAVPRKNSSRGPASHGE